MQPQNWYPCHNLPQTCGGIKSICPFCMCTTEHLQSHLRTSFSINELWSSKWDIHKSTINKSRFLRMNLRIFYINQNSRLMSTSSYTRLAPSPWTSTNLRGNKIRIYGLGMTHIKIAITPREKFQDKWTLIWSKPKKKLTIKNLRSKLKLQRTILLNSKWYENQLKEVTFKKKSRPSIDWLL